MVMCHNTVMTDETRQSVVSRAAGRNAREAEERAVRNGSPRVTWGNVDHWTERQCVRQNADDMVSVAGRKASNAVWAVWSGEWRDLVDQWNGQDTADVEAAVETARADWTVDNWRRAGRAWQANQARVKAARSN